jgi:hypothetical protein
MKRTLLLTTLAEAKRQVEQGERCIEDQRRIIIALRKARDDTAAAEEALRDLELAQTLYLADVGRTLDALAKIPTYLDDDHS